MVRRFVSQVRVGGGHLSPRLLRNDRFMQPKIYSAALNEKPSRFSLVTKRESDSIRFQLVEQYGVVAVALTTAGFRNLAKFGVA